MSTLITGDSLGMLVQSARTACAGGAVLNLLIEGRLSIDALQAPFIETYRNQAEMWQASVRPPSLYMSHGEYIHRHGDGVRYLIDELVKKPTGNRAIMSLIDMKDLIGSGDEPRPSFMLFQAGFESGDKTTLYVTAYYRALEVSRFLPINLAEASLLLTTIQREIPEIRHFHLLIHAFRAYENVDFNCLVRSELDSVGASAIEAAVKSLDVKKLHGWLHSKLAASSVVETDALILLRAAIADSKEYPPNLVEHLDGAILHFSSLLAFRRAGSHVELLGETADRANQKLGDAMRALEGMNKWS